MLLKSKLQELLRDQGISRAKLAEAVGVSEVSIGNYIYGKTNPSLEVAMLIGRALGLRVEDIWSLPSNGKKIIPKNFKQHKFVCWMGKNGFSVQQIAAKTGYKLPSIYRILKLQGIKLSGKGVK